MREIILDTETTGLSLQDGHRVIEIAACEMKDYILTGKTFHVYVNPEREIDTSASDIHGLKKEDLEKQPKFNQICNDLINFIKDSRLVIHNADFDISFLNNEFEICGSNYRIKDNYIDTIKLARKKLPGTLVNLDALCRRYSISLNNREYHGALVDTHLLAEVYIELIGGKQTSFELATETKLDNGSNLEVSAHYSNKEKINARQFSPNRKELDNHVNFIKEIKNPMWDKYL